MGNAVPSQGLFPYSPCLTLSSSPFPLSPLPRPPSHPSFHFSALLLGRLSHCNLACGGRQSASYRTVCDSVVSRSYSSTRYQRMKNKSSRRHKWHHGIIASSHHRIIHTYYVIASYSFFISIHMIPSSCFVQLSVLVWSHDSSILTIYYYSTRPPRLSVRRSPQSLGK